MDNSELNQAKQRIALVQKLTHNISPITNNQLNDVYLLANGESWRFKLAQNPFPELEARNPSKYKIN